MHTAMCVGGVQLTRKRISPTCLYPVPATIYNRQREYEHARAFELMHLPQVLFSEPPARATTSPPASTDHVPLPAAAATTDTDETDDGGGPVAVVVVVGETGADHGGAGTAGTAGPATTSGPAPPKLARSMTAREMLMAGVGGGKLAPEHDPLPEDDLEVVGSGDDDDYDGGGAQQPMPLTAAQEQELAAAAAAAAEQARLETARIAKEAAEAAREAAFRAVMVVDVPALPDPFVPPAAAAAAAARAAEAALEVGWASGGGGGGGGEMEGAGAYSHGAYGHGGELDLDALDPRITPALLGVRALGGVRSGDQFRTCAATRMRDPAYRAAVSWVVVVVVVVVRSGRVSVRSGWRPGGAVDEYLAL